MRICTWVYLSSGFTYLAAEGAAMATVAYRMLAAGIVAQFFRKPGPRKLADRVYDETKIALAVPQRDL
jgi:hypothetical protein